MTTRRIWTVALLLVALWTMAALVGWGLIDLVGGFAVDRADVAARDPDHVAWIAWFFDTLRGLGVAAVVAAWLIVTTVILGIAALLARATRDRGRFTDARR